ncbi:MAG TPA: DoxX family protein [bacterium]|nr:DoxX family protein [bacterium]
MSTESRSTTLDLALLGLRIGLGVLFVRAGWAKVTNIHGVVGLWQRLHLPLPAVFGPIHAVVEFGGGILLLAGLLTWLVSLLLAVDMVGALLLVKLHTPTFINQEWLALWISLALLATGAGAISLDAYLRGRGAPGPAQRRGRIAPRSALP